MKRSPIRKWLRFVFRVVAFALGLTFLIAPTAWAFGCEGHEIIALIAEKHLTPHARAMALQILKDNLIDPSLPRYCKQPDLDPIAYSATWADDYRTVNRATGPWHEIDLPISISKGKISDYCPVSEGCIVRALRDEIAFLRSADTDPPKRADALRFVIHQVGDLHQPLHAADNNDLGGNCVPVTFFGTSPKLINQYETYSLNLHQLWDYALLQKALPGEGPAQMADEIDHAYARVEKRSIKGGVDIDAWTWESFRLAKSVAYGKLPVKIPAEAPISNHSCTQDDHISLRMLKLNEQVGQPYEDAAVPVIEQQIARAGARLAFILNQIWPQSASFLTD